MTWFEFYAAFGAPVLLFGVCVALVSVERALRRKRMGANAPIDKARATS